MLQGRIVAALSSGLLALSFGLLGGCVEQESNQPTAADWKVIKQNILKKAPSPKYKVNADLEGKVTYIGLDVDRDKVRPGQPFTLTHYWKVNKPVPGWRLFVHLNDPSMSGKNFVNADHKPIGGRYPVTLWKAGEIIRDAHKVTLSGKWNKPMVYVYTGLWKGKLRMKPKGPSDGQNRVLAAKIPVDVSGVKGGKGAERKRVVALRTDKPVKLDGKLNDPVWQKAPSTGAFVDPMSGGEAKVKTEAKLAWNDKYLYVAFHNVDKDIWSKLRKRDDKLWTQEAVEMFIDADGDGEDYVELQVNPAGTIFDSYLPKYRKNDNAWNSKMKVAVEVNGTLNKRDDADESWTVEMAIPWADTKGKGKGDVKLPPRPGDVWRVNFFRLDRPEEKRQLAAAWSAPQVGDFHKLDRFGELVFADAAGKVPKAADKGNSDKAKQKAEPKGKKKAAAPTPSKGSGGTAGKVVRIANPQGSRTVHSLHEAKPVLPAKVK